MADMDERLQRAPVGVLDVSSDGAVTGVNDVAKDLMDADDVPLGVTLDEFGPRSVDDSLLDVFEAESVTEAEFEEYYPDLDLWLAVSVIPTDDGATIFLQDETKRCRHEQSVERLRSERKRTAVIDEVLSKVLADLVDASSRAEIAETICTELGETELYEFAWVGEREAGSEDLVIRGSAGETGETFAAVRDALDDPAQTPEERAVETGLIQTAQPIAEAAEIPEPVRMAGFADGVQSVLAIPLVYGSNVYGVVGVYASGNDAFSDRERTSFRTLGEIAGFAVKAARNRNLLLSDVVTEITFDVGAGSALASLSGEIDAEITLEGMVPQEDETMRCFVAVEGDVLEDVPDVATGMEGVRDTRIVSAGNSGGTVGIEVQEPAPLIAIPSLGGTVRRATFDSGVGRMVVDLPQDGDVRRIADTVRDEYDAEVVAKRERERSVTTAHEFRDELDDRLTERQKTVLRTAYLSDYFESPRGSTAEEVATSLDITGSTLLHHLRASQRKLLDAFFSENTGPAE